MFEDLEEESVDVSADSPDRAIAWAIHTRGESGNVTPEEGWAILHERYPDDARFLLLNLYAEVAEVKKQESGNNKPADVLNAGYLLKKIERVTAADPTGALEPQLRELTTFGSAILAGAKDDELATLKALRDRLGIEGEAKRDDRDRAGLKLRRFEREVLKELDDRTQDNKPLGVARVTAPKSDPASDWASAVADTSKAKSKYAPAAKLAAGELVEHPKFGVGVVTGTEPGKAVILFESGVRKLVAGA
ncbi:MAG: hypothetical protein KIT84_07215 [Labilithrix sp.]|nr:hypothetical protein [Labilithrix sp.]MCW5810784.1 hypothetical protein [Labilithrix sp.]